MTQRSSSSIEPLQVGVGVLRQHADAREDLRIQPDGSVRSGRCSGPRPVLRDRPRRRHDAPWRRRAAKDRHVRAALLEQADLVLLQRLADLVVGDVRDRAGSGPPVLNAVFCSSRHSLCAAWCEDGIMSVAVNNHVTWPLPPPGRPLRTCARSRVYPVYVATLRAGPSGPRRWPIAPLTLDRAARHHRAGPQTFQRLHYFLHLGRPAQAMHHHSIEIIVEPRFPALLAPAGVERSEHFGAHPRSLRSERAFGGQRLDALHHHRSDHLDR